MTIFSHIVRKRFSHTSEDVATDGLAYLIERSDRTHEAMHRFLRAIEPGLPDLRFRTQEPDTGMRPDLVGSTDNRPRLYVENKFWAGLTDQQPVAYLERLASDQQPALLLVVAPQARQGTLWRELRSRLDAAGVAYDARSQAPGTYAIASTAWGPTLALASWDQLLTALEHAALDDPPTLADLTQLRALCRTADEDAHLPLTREQLTDQRTPALIRQLGAIVREATDRAIEHGILTTDGLRPQASWERLGRYAWLPDRTGAGAWFGIHFAMWRRHGVSPLWVVFSSTDFGRATEVRPRIETWAAEHDRTVTFEDDHLSIVLELPAAQEHAAVVRHVTEQLGELARQCSALPTSVYASE
ncbi:MAG: hypothetical protein U5K81_04235 [Trueperaceae bacterium]|nr:hypothetical protein [Trueperaceae bacterium]